MLQAGRPPGISVWIFTHLIPMNLRDNRRKQAIMKGRGLPSPVDRVLLYFFCRNYRTTNLHKTCTKCYNPNIQNRRSIRQKQPGISGKNHRGGNMN